MKIGIDAMGGDNAPLEIVKGAYLAAKENEDINFILFGTKSVIDNLETDISSCENIEIVDTLSVVTMEDDPMIVMKEKNDSSMAVGLRALKNGEIDTFISAGSTGALHTASTLIVRKIKGIRRSAIATVIPFETPILMLDSGANPTVTSDILNQWAILGSIYVEQMYGVKNPRVGLLNNGTEEHKGTPEVMDAYQLLKKNDRINFIGNVEAKELPKSPCDVLITDGFTGNITLKLLEGMGAFMFRSLRKIFESNLKTKMSYIMVKDKLKSLKNSFDASEYGGAPLLGTAKPVIKAHGSSTATDIKNAVRQAKAYVSTGIIDKVADLI